MYNVGDILYVVLKENQVILPIQVCEEIVTRTLEKVDTTYVVHFYAEKKFTKVNINNIKGEIFKNFDDLKLELTNRYLDALDKTISEANAKSKMWFAIKDKEDITNQTTSTIIDLGNGQLAKLKE